MTDTQSHSTTPVSDALRSAGNWNPAWDLLAELDAGYTEKFLGMATHADKHLERRDREEQLRFGPIVAIHGVAGPRSFGPGLVSARVHLDRDGPPWRQHLEQEGQPVTESPSTVLTKLGVRICRYDLGQGGPRPVAGQARWPDFVRPHPQFRLRAVRGNRPLLKAGQEDPRAPVIAEENR